MEESKRVDITKIIDKLNKKAEEQLALKNEYVQLLDMLSEHNCFDSKDKQLIQERIEMTQRQHEQTCKEIEEKEKLYEEKIVKLQEILDERQEVLEAADSETQILTNDPELLDAFVTKQSELQAKLDRVTETLLKER